MFILIGIVLVAGTAFAAPSVSLKFHYNLGGSARYGIVDNNKLYCVIGSRLFIADVADTTRPVEQGSLALPGIGRRISKKDTVLYVACTEGGMVTVDVSDPQNPKQLAQIIFDKPDAVGKTFDVAIQGSYAYVADHTGFHVVDITDPAAPVLKSSFTDFTNPRHLAYDVMIEDNYAYLCCEGDGLYIFDIRNPVAPVKVTQWKDAENNFGQFYQSARSGNYLYIAGGIKGIVVLDVADVKDPKLVSNFVGEQGVWGGAIGLVHVGSYCYIQDEFFNMHCIDVSDPAHPNETGSFNTEGHHSLGIWNDGSRVVLANSTYGIRILDTNGTQVTQLGAFRSPGRIMDCAGSGSHAYLAAGENGLKIFDVTHPDRPTLAAEVALGGFANGIYVTGGRAYVVGTLGTGDDENQGGFLEVVDVQNPMAPEVTGSVEVSGEPFDVVVRNDIAYVATQTAGVTLVNVTDPAHPSVLATYDTTGLCYGLDLMGDFLIGADGLDGIVILDVRDPTYPKKLFSSPLLTSVLHASVWDTYGYLAGGSQGLMIVDLTVPFVPQSSAVVEPLMIRNQPAQTKASVAFNSYLFEVETIGNLGAVRLFDLQEPENPIELDGNAYLVGDPLKVSYSPEQGLAYVASQIAGLYIYAVTLSDEPQVDIEGRWLGSAGDDGIVLELDQAHTHVSGTAVIVGAQTQQAVLSGTISGNVFAGTMTPSGVFSLALQDNGTLTGTINDRAVLLTRIADRGFFTLKNASAQLRDAIARYKASTPPVQRVFLNIAENALDASLASTTLSGALKQAAIAHAVLDIPPVSGPIAAAYRYLYPAGY